MKKLIWILLLFIFIGCHHSTTERIYTVKVVDFSHTQSFSIKAVSYKSQSRNVYIFYSSDMHKVGEVKVNNPLETIVITSIIEPCP